MRASSLRQPCVNRRRYRLDMRSIWATLRSAEFGGVEGAFMPEFCVPQLVEEPPEFEFRGGLFYVSDPRIGIVRAYRPNTYFATLAAMAACARKYRTSGAQVIPIAPRALHAASASGNPSK